MAVKLPDTLVPMADFPSAYAKDVQFTDGENLQDKLDKGKLGSSSSGTGLTEEQANNIEKIPSIEGIVTSNSQAITNKADKDHEHTEYLTEIPDEYVTDTELSTELNKKVNKETGKGLSTNDLTNELVTKINSSATEAFVTNAIANAQLDGGDVDLSGYATVDALNLKANLTHTHDQYLTKVPDEYITETELNAKGYLTEHQDISNLALKSEIPDVSSFITSDDLPTVPTKVSELTNDKNYISSIPSEYVTETELNAKKYLTSVPSTYALKTDIPTVPTKTSDLTNDSGYLSTKDITNTINSTSTETQIPTAKAVNVAIKGKLITQDDIDTYGKEIIKFPVGKWVIGSVAINNLTDLPNSYVRYVEIMGISEVTNPWTNNNTLRSYKATSYKGDTFLRSLNSGSEAGVIVSDTGWQRVLLNGDIIDNLTSTDTNKLLSANQGKILNDEIDLVLSTRNVKTYTNITQLGLTAPVITGRIYNALPENSIFQCEIVDNKTVSDTPENTGILTIQKSSKRLAIEFKASARYSVYPNNLYLGQLKGDDGSGIAWNKVALSSDLEGAINELNSIINTLQNRVAVLENQQSATVSVTGVTLSTNTLSMKVGGTTTLTANIRPSNATNKNVTWSTNNGSVASVSNGVVTAKAKGQATITVTTADGGYTDSCLVTVSETVTTISVTGVTLSSHALTMDKIGGTQTLNYTITPNNATNKNVTWSTSVPTVASINNGIVTANANGTTVITIRTTDGGHTDTCTVTVNDPSYVDGGGDDKLYVPDIASYGISKDGTNSEATTNGLNRLFADVNTSGKTNVQLPTGTYAINPDISLTPKSNLTLDLNNSKLKIDTNGKNGSTMVYLKEVENFTLKNGTIEGDRYDHDYSTYNENTTSHEFNVGLKIDQGSRNVNVDNVKFTKITGYGLATFQGTQYCNVALDKTKMESGDYNDSGSKVADATKIRYPQAVNITEHATHGYLQVGTLLKYQNYVFNSTRVVTVRMFNASGSLVSKVTSNMYRPIVVPSNATTAYLTFHQSDPKDYLEGDMYTLDVFHMKPPRDCNITNCTFDDNRCLGIAVCGGWNIKIEDNTFKNTSKPTSDTSSPNYQHGKPGYAIDIEDGWESTQDLTINNNTFTNNGFGDIVSLAGDNTVITNNQFTGRVAMYSRNTNYVVKNNTITNGIAMWETEKDYGFTVDHNTYTDATIKAKCYKPYDDDYYSFTNETITNGQMQLDTSITLKNSTITLDGSTNARFTGSYDTCTIKNFDGSDSNSDYNTGIKLNNCDVSNSNFFPSKDTVMTNNTFNTFRVRLDNGTLVFTGNDIQSNPKNTSMPIVQLNGGKTATIKKNTLGSAVTVDLYTNPAGIEVITDDYVDDFNWDIEVEDNESPQFNYYKAGLYHANGIDGRGIKIGLFDSSYRSATNSDLVVKDLNNTTASTDDHATMVAGVIGSKKFGIAPGAELYNVVGEKTSSEVTGIVGAIDKAIAGGIKIFVITAGWSGMNNISNDNLQQISNAFDRAKEAGMFVFLSGGNTPNSMLLERPQEIGWKVIMISGCDANGEYANQGTENYYSAVSSFYSCYSYKGKSFATGINEGTSVSTPLAAGLCALMLQQKPDFTPDELRRYLIDTAKYPDPDTSNTKKGLIQLTRINKNTKYVTQSEIDAEEDKFVDMTAVNLKNIGDYTYNSSNNQYELKVSKGTVLDLSHTLEPANCTDHVRWSCGRKDLFTIDNDSNKVTCSSTATGFNILQAKDRHYNTLLRLKITIS